MLKSHDFKCGGPELKGVVESLASRCEGDVIREKDIYKAVPEATAIKSIPSRNLVGAYSASLIMNERQRFEKAIIRANGNRADAAKELGISRATFFRRAKELGLVRTKSIEGGGKEQSL